MKPCCTSLLTVKKPRRLALTPLSLFIRRHAFNKANATVTVSCRHYTAIPLGTTHTPIHPQGLRYRAVHLNTATASNSAAAVISKTATKACVTARDEAISSVSVSYPSLIPSAAPASANAVRSSSAAALVQAEEKRAGEYRHHRSAARIACVRVPRLLVFGGDVVSVTALEALHARMRCIVREALRRARCHGTFASSNYHRSSNIERDAAEEEDAQVDTFVRAHLTVVCPALPKNMTPEAAAKRFTRQYPVARYCVDHGLPIIPVDDSRSLARSTLLKEMLSTAPRSSPPSPSSTASSAHTWAAHGRSLSDYDLAVVVSFRYFLPQRLLRALPPVINMHPSLLPRYRGASPIFSALRHNEDVGGVSIIQMKADQKGMDSGSILWQCEVPMTTDMDIRLYFPLVTQIGAAGLCDLIFGEAPAVAPAMSISGSSTDENTSRTSCQAGHVREHGNTSMIASATSSTAKMNPHGNGTATQMIETLSGSAAPRGRPVLPFSSSSAAPSRAGNSTSSTDVSTNLNSTNIPPWAALRRNSLLSPLHQSYGSCSSSGNVAFPIHSRERLFPYVDRHELSLFSSIITAFTTDFEAHKGTVEDDTTVSQRVPSCVEEGSDRECNGCAVNVPLPTPGRHWTTLCRRCSHITPEAVHAASTAHRALFFQNLEHESDQSETPCPPGKRQPHTPAHKKQVSPAAAAEMEISTTMKCAEVFPQSVLSGFCDWPDSFTYSWKFAQTQEYETFAHFTDDPYHAPLLPKDVAVLRFSAFTAREAFGVWRAFVGGDYFQPSMNATLDKGSTPVRNQLVHRGVRRLLREQAKARQQKYKKTTGDAATTACATTSPQVTQLNSTAKKDEAVTEDSSVGTVVGKHVKLNVSHPTALQLLAEAENTLRIPCAFTRVTNPLLVPSGVLEELATVERGEAPGILPCGGGPPATRAAAPLPGRRVRFYRAPPAVFRAALSTAAAPKDEPPQRQSSLSRSEAADLLESTNLDTSSAAQAEKTRLSKRQQQQQQKPSPPCHLLPSSKSAKHQAEEPCDSEEASEDYVPDIIHAAPPTEHHHCHIPPGTGYFPQSDESYGAIKCKNGWFLWKEAHMKWTNKAQPAVLIRKGLAMKTGVLYVGLFSEYS